MTSLYSLVSIGAAFRITRFDGDLNPESTYELDHELCSCPAGTKQTCRHRKMLLLFETAGHVNDGYFLDWDTRLWRKPLAEVSEMFDDSETKCGGLADPTTIPPEGDAPEPSTLAANQTPSASASGRGQPSPIPASAQAAGSEVASPPPPDPQPASAERAASSVPAGGQPLFRRRVL